MAPFGTGMRDCEVQERLFKALTDCLPEEGMGLIWTDKNKAWVSVSRGMHGLVQDTDILAVAGELVGNFAGIVVTSIIDNDDFPTIDSTRSFQIRNQNIQVIAEYRLLVKYR